MSIEAIAALNSQAISSLAPPLESTKVTDTAFESMLSELNNINSSLAAKQADMQNLAAGNTENLHQVMMGMEQTHLQFEMLLQVRNKVLDAYQELMRMQI